jgi:hypothetical protein
MKLQPLFFYQNNQTGNMDKKIFNNTLYLLFYNECGDEK